MPESRPRKTKIQWTNLRASLNRSVPEAKLETSSITSSSLTKQHMTPWKVAPNYKLVTPAVVSERPRNPSSLARAALQELLSKGLSTPLSKHRAQVVYTRNTKGGDAPAAGEDAVPGPTSCTFWKIKLYYKKLWANKPHLWPRIELLQRLRIPASFRGSATTFHIPVSRGSS